MFIDQNITQTKAFQEQLDQHAEMFASWSDLTPKMRERVFPRLRETFASTVNRLQSFLSTDFKFDTGKSA